MDMGARTVAEFGGGATIAVALVVSCPRGISVTGRV